MLVLRRHTELMTMMMRRQWLKHGWLLNNVSRRHALCSSRPLGVHHTQLICRTLSSVASSSSSSSLSSRLGPEPSAIGYNDYEAERRTFRLDQPQFYNFASDVIDRWARTEQVISSVLYSVYPSLTRHAPSNLYNVSIPRTVTDFIITKSWVYIVYIVSAVSVKNEIKQA